MPIQQSVSVCKFEEAEILPVRHLPKQECLLRLRTREVIAYHHFCGALRAQGQLTPEKLRLLREVKAALFISDARHRTECNLALDDREARAIAEGVAGPHSDMEWRRESIDVPQTLGRVVNINTASLRLADAFAMAVQEQMDLMGEDDEQIITEVKIDASLFEDLEDETKNSKKTKPDTKVVEEEEEELDEEEEMKEGNKTGELTASVSPATEKPNENDQAPKEDDQKIEVQETTSTKEDTDMSLMPPPPPVITVPPPSVPISPPPPVITVPPPVSMTVVPPPTPIVTVPVEISEAIQSPMVETPVFSETDEAQAQAEAQAHADFLSSLPPLVVVPPPDPMETSTAHSPSQPATLVLSPNMSIQLRDDTKKRKRTLSQESGPVTNSPATKTMALGSFSKMTPVMVSASGTPVVSSQTQVKVTPIISRGKMATTSQASSGQKVIIVSSTQSSSTPILQRSLNVPMGTVGLPIIRTNQPRFQAVPVSGQVPSGNVIRPKMVTVPAKCRAKGSSMVNLQLKNAITLKQDNVTVVDTSVKRLPGPAKILPKPSGSMFIVNTGHGTHKLATSVGTGRLASSEGTKQNVVIVQKGGNQRTLTLSNPNKDFMQKLMSKKCVVIQSSKVLPKTISPKVPSLPPPVTTTAGNVVVLDLSQEQYRQNLSTTTIAEILQASGIITSSAQPLPPQNPTFTEASPVTSGESEWLPVETSKSLSLEEVTLPIGQSETFVTLDEAVEMLGGDHPTESAVAVGEGGGFSSADSNQIFTITPDQLGGNLTMVGDKPEPMTNQIVIETLPSEVVPEMDCVTQTFMPHKDGAVTIQHSNIDVPANMSLEEYSSQQFENQNLN